MGTHLRPYSTGSNTDDAFYCCSNVPELFKCECCEFETVLKISLHNHMDTFHKEKETNIDLRSILGCYQCENCEFQTYSLLVLSCHVCEKVENWLKSEECSYKTRWKWSLKSHIISEHVMPRNINWLEYEQCWRNTTDKNVVKQEETWFAAKYIYDDLIDSNNSLSVYKEFRSEYDPSPAEISDDSNTVEDTRKRRKLTCVKESNPITKIKLEKDKSTTGIENLTQLTTDKTSNERESNRKTTDGNISKASKIKLGQSGHSSEKHLKNSILDEKKEVQDVVTFDFAKKHENDGKRVRDKGHACYFCDRVIGNMARHFEIKHGRETEVVKILAMPKCSKQRRDGFAELIRIGDFQHNCNVLSLKSGELILVRRPSEKEKMLFKYSDYGPCPDCLGFILKKHMWHHVKHGCSVIKRNEAKYEVKQKIVSESKALVNGLIAPEFSSDYIKHIVSKLRDDDIGRICQNDRTILNFGYLQFEKYGTTQCESIRQLMRQVGRLLLEIQRTKNNIKELSECLIPQNFDTIVAATKTLCVTTVTDDSRPQFKVPSLALKIGHTLKKCIAFLRGQALRQGKLKTSRNYKCLQQLMKLEWSSKISSHALTMLQKRKFNNNEIIPLTEDLVKLRDFLDKQINLFRQQLSENCNKAAFKKLQTYTLARIILLNKRRSGEASRITLEQFRSMPSHETQSRDSLSPLEKTLSLRLNVVEVVGKRRNEVPVLITPDVNTCIETLLEKRDEVGIRKENVYIFARTNLGHLKGHACLKIACEEANLRYPSIITSAKLRKYIATVCQLFYVSENEQDWLSRHLGYDIKVHNLHKRTVEAAKVSRLLLAAEKGELNTFAGKSLEEINISDLPALEDDEETTGEPVNSNDEYDDTRESDSTDNEVTEETGKAVPQKKKVAIKRTILKTYWTEDEKKVVLNYFTTEIKSKVLPGKKRCEQCISENAALQTRKWSDIKFYIKNFYTKKAKMVR